MKNQLIKVVLLASLTVCFSGVFAAVDTNTITVVNHTRVDLFFKHANGYKFVDFSGSDHWVRPNHSRTYNFADIGGNDQEEYLSISRPSDSSRIFLGLEADGVHGYVASKYSYRWTSSANHPVVTVCQVADVSKCS